MCVFINYNEWYMFQALEEHEIQEDLPQALGLLREMNTNVNQVSDLVESMLQKVKNGELSTEYGLSFLEVKYHMLLTYLINLTYVVLRKCSGMLWWITFIQTFHKLIQSMFYLAGKQIENDPAIDRLVEIRTVLEKIRPIDHKLRYQIDKLVKTAVTGITNSSDPSTFKVKHALKHFSNRMYSFINIKLLFYWPAKSK